MMTFLLLTLLYDDGYFQSQQLQYLPEWAFHASYKTKIEDAPKGAKGWVLSNELLLGFDRDGYMLVRHRIVKAVLDQGGAEAASTYAQNVSADVGSVLRVTGWHVPNLGPIQKLNMEDTVTFGNSDGDVISTDATTATGFDYVSKGSVVAFESVVREKSFLGAIGAYPAISEFPTRVFRIALVEENGEGRNIRLGPVNFDHWQIRTELAKTQLVAYNLPGLQRVPLSPPHLSFYPYVTAQFLSDKEDQERYADWDHYARWYYGVFMDAALGGKAPELGKVEIETLRRMCKPLQGQITYHQVYLSNARGFVPIKGEEVLSRAYGDCKDMAACFAYLGSTEKVRVLPALANIANGAYTTERSPTYPMFNHLIAAVPLSESLGLPAEVNVKGRTYLIFDATSADTSFGYLPDAYIGRSVLICTEKGADWVEIPDKAIEPGKLTWRLKGKLDGSGLFKGTIQLREQGNAYYYRTLIGRYGKQLATKRVRQMLPNSAMVELTQAGVDEGGIATAEWTVTWPRFLQAAGPGYQLPEAILPALETELRYANQAREMPLFIEGRPATTWSLDIELEKPLKVAHGESAFQSNSWQYAWQVQAGSRLSGSFELSLAQRAYPRAQVGTGVKDWLTFSQNYEDFRREKALLMSP